MTEIRISCASDDLVEISGAIREEFYTNRQDSVIAVSDGTLLRAQLDADEVWRITPIVKGSGALTITQAPGNDPDNYSDIATLSGLEGHVWVAHADDYAVVKTNCGWRRGDHRPAGQWVTPCPQWAPKEDK